MIAFWDTSAILPLILREPYSGSANAAWSASTHNYAWSWLRVEAESGLIRRKASSKQWKTLTAVFDTISWIELGSQKFEQICTFNRKAGLRATEAGHLFCFQQASIVLPDLKLVCFDEEICAAVIKLRLHVWGKQRTVEE